jgi:hypothetical protein
MSFDTKGIGEYHATYEIDSRHTSMDTSVFDAIATMTVSRKAIRNATSVMKGSVTIGLYPVESSEELIMSLVSYPALTESLVESYFITMEKLETRMAGDHYELTGTGELRVSDTMILLNYSTCQLFVTITLK